MLLLALSCLSFAATPQQISLSWAATDALGRKLPDYQTADNQGQDKYVAMFYWLWHMEKNVDSEPVNISEIVRNFPEAVNDYNHPVWAQNNAFGPCHWNEPLFGYYRSTDRWVLRKHAEMLADAGVDVVVFDCTNAPFTWDAAFNELGEVWLEARNDGVKTPQFAFLCPFGPTDGSKDMVQKLWLEIYKRERFKDLWFYWKDKPLIMAYPDNLPEETRDFFTFRPCQPDYRRGPTRPDQWSWLEVYPQHGFAEYSPGKYEMVSVSVAQNATAELAPAAMNDRKQVFGRSYTHKNGFDEKPDAHLYGYNFEEQWSRVFELDPELVFVTGWNEWVAGRFQNWQGTDNAFPDQFCDEYSRDIEPVKGSHGDNYYYQLVANIRKFKGAEKPPVAKQSRSIDIDGDFADWSSAGCVYYDHKGDTLSRNHRGYGSSLLYRNDSGRNDFVSLKAAFSENNLFFYACCADNIKRPANSGRMLLFIDIDRDKSTGWQGYDYLINSSQTAGGKASIEKNVDGKWSWIAAGGADFATGGKEIEIGIPRAVICGEDASIDIEFKWADNIKGNGDVMDFYISGDTAPSARFNYVFSSIETANAAK
jgi:hypothetical protein